MISAIGTFFNISAIFTYIFQENNTFKVENSEYTYTGSFMMEIQFIKLVKMDMSICYILNHWKTKEQTGTSLYGNKISVGNGFFSGSNDYRIFYFFGNAIYLFIYLF